MAESAAFGPHSAWLQLMHSTVLAYVLQWAFSKTRQEEPTHRYHILISSLLDDIYIYHHYTIHTIYYVLHTTYIYMRTYIFIYTIICHYILMISDIFQHKVILGCRISISTWRALRTSGSTAFSKSAGLQVIIYAILKRTILSSNWNKITTTWGYWGDSLSA